MSMAIVGASETDTVGVIPDTSAIQLHAEAALNALADAGLKPSDIDAVLCAGDQLVFDGQHRFVVEYPTVAGVEADAEPPAMAASEAVGPAPAPGRAGVRLPWLLLAALLLGGLISALLWFGAR